MFFLGLGTAAPHFVYQQEQCWEAIQGSPQFSQLESRSRSTLRKVLLGPSGVETRHLALERLSDAFLLTPDVLHQRFAQWAPRLASQAAHRALADAGLTPREIDAVVVSTCTGYLCPGLSSYVTELLGLRPNVVPLDLVGQGCGAALPNLTAARGLLQTGSQHVLSICVEICSAAFYLDNDLGVLISACLFGDGAGAAVLGREARATGPRLEWKESGSLTVTADRELLRFESRNGMLRNVLSLQVPRVAAVHAATLFETVAESAGVSREEIQGWIWHAGGREVLKALQAKFQLTDDQVESSAAVLRHYGNISSASVYFSLQEKLHSPAAPHGWWWLSSFGAGFSCHGALLQKF